MRPSTRLGVVAAALMSVAAAPAPDPAVDDLEFLEFLGGIDLAPDAVEELPESGTEAATARPRAERPQDVEKRP
jgi:hypothetical protein